MKTVTRLASSCLFGFILLSPIFAKESFYVWGDNSYGQLGDSSNKSYFSPRKVNFDDFTQISCGGKVDYVPDTPIKTSYSLALRIDGTVWACGYNAHGQLGNNSKNNSNRFVQVSGLKNVVDIGAGGEHSLALKQDGTVWAWGLNWAGQCGFNPETDYYFTTPRRISGISQVVSVFAGEDTSFFLKQDGTVWACGNASSGQLGDGQSKVNRYIPIRVIGLTDIISIASGEFQTFALSDNGTVWACGSNQNGHLGIVGEVERNLATKIPNLSDIISISSGALHTLALKKDGTVWVWGGNESGQLGLGDHIDRFRPTKIANLTDISFVCAGKYSSLAFEKNGNIWAWGNNKWGQLGTGNTTTSISPIEIANIPNLRSVSVGETHVIALALEQKKDLSLQVVVSDYKIADTSRVVDGNQVTIRALVKNSGEKNVQISVLFHNGASTNDPYLPGRLITKQPITLNPNSEKEISWLWDTMGYAWDNNFNKQSERTVAVEVLESGNSSISLTKQITVIPRPLILVHGFLSDASAWDKYKEYAHNHNSLWLVRAVGDGLATGEMNMGKLWPPKIATFTIEKNAHILSEYIDEVREKTNAQHIDIVAHSMGGLVSRYYIHKLMPQSDKGDNRPVVCNLFMLGTPNLGAWESDALNGLLDLLGNPARQQLSKKNVEKFNNEINNGKDVLWWGFRGNLSFPALGLGDGVVAIESARYTILDRFLNRKRDGSFEERGITHMNLNSDRGIFNDFVVAALCRGPKNQVKND